MKIALDLHWQLEDRLSKEASRLKLGLTECILRLLDGRSFLQNSPKTGAELVAFWENTKVLNSRPNIIDSQEYPR